MPNGIPCMHWSLAGMHTSPSPCGSPLNLGRALPPCRGRTLHRHVPRSTRGSRTGGNACHRAACAAQSSHGRSPRAPHSRRAWLFPRGDAAYELRGACHLRRYWLGWRDSLGSPPWLPSAPRRWLADGAGLASPRRRDQGWTVFHPPTRGGRYFIYLPP